MEKQEKQYTTWGRVRGDCGHVHDSLLEAVDCISRDQHGCQQQGGCSDREVRIVDGRDEIEHYDVTIGPGVAWSNDTIPQGVELRIY